MLSSFSVAYLPVASQVKKMVCYTLITCAPDWRSSHWNFIYFFCLGLIYSIGPKINVKTHVLQFWEILLNYFVDFFLFFFLFSLEPAIWVLDLLDWPCKLKKKKFLSYIVYLLLCLCLCMCVVCLCFVLLYFLGGFLNFLFQPFYWISNFCCSFYFYNSQEVFFCHLNITFIASWSYFMDFFFFYLLKMLMASLFLQEGNEERFFPLLHSLFLLSFCLSWSHCFSVERCCATLGCLLTCKNGKLKNYLGALRA